MDLTPPAPTVRDASSVYAVSSQPLPPSGVGLGWVGGRRAQMLLVLCYLLLVRLSAHTAPYTHAPLVAALLFLQARHTLERESAVACPGPPALLRMPLTTHSLSMRDEHV